MKKIQTLFFIVFILVISVNAQETNSINIRCASSELTDLYFKSHPNQKTKFDAYQATFNAKINTRSLQKTAATPNYTIPMVFHILHLNGNENISDAQVLDQVNILNIDFAKKNADTSLTLPVFKSIADSTSIRFALAKKDPNGNCTSGIVHYYNADSKWDDNSLTLYAQGWDPTMYLNVYVVKSITLSNGFNAAGYTYLPGTFSSGDPTDAIVILNSYVGTIGTSNVSHSHVLTHEVGHWLNLLHVFGWNSCAVDCNNDDFVFDTPQTPGYLSCPINSQICTPGITENYQNFMDYSYCETMFTHEQALRMDAAAHDNIVGRDNLWTSTNLTNTGIIGTLSCTPVANFQSSKQVNCLTNSITFTNQSFVGNSGTVSWIFEGGTPSTSSSTTTQVVTYATSGTYSVSLTATNANGTNTLNKVGYITIVNGAFGSVAPKTYNFEGASLPTDIKVINDNLGSISWAQNANVGANTTLKSIFLNNIASSTSGQLDVFETPIFDFSNTTNVSLSYWYAYAKYSSTQNDTFKLQYSTDCGGTWTNVIGYPTLTSMAINSGGTSTTAFIPASSQWKKVTVSSAMLSNLDFKPSVKFRFYFRSDATIGISNNIYFDEINLSGTVGLNELENTIGLTIYPNPTNSSSKVDLTITGAESVKISVTDVLGRLIEEPITPILNGKNITYIVNKNGVLAKGIYIVNIDVNNQRISKKLIID